MCEKRSNRNPLGKANIINKFFFWWLKDIISYGEKNDLKPDDLYDTMPEDSSEPLRGILEKAWEKEVTDAKLKEKKPSLSKVIIKTYYWDFMKFAFFPVSYIITMLVGPELFGIIMLYFDSPSTISTLEAYLYTTFSILLMVIQQLVNRYGNFTLARLGIQVKIACSSLIYKKITKLHCSLSNDQNNSTSAISLLSMDVNTFELLAYHAIYVILLPLQVLAVIYFIYSHVGLVPSVIGVSLMVLQNVPLQTLYYHLTMKLKAEQAANTDKRISLIDEIVAAVRAIKMYAWENHFQERSFLARKLEIQGFLKMSYLMAAANAFVIVSHRVCSFIVTIICYLQFNQISVTSMLIVRQHFYNLRENMCFLFFQGVQSIVSARVAIKRIEAFLSIPEVNSEVKKMDDQQCSGTVLIKNVTASWSPNAKYETFKNISVDFMPQKLYAILGTTGCGKSSLLKLILGELEASSGQVSVGGEISYANQEPWLFAGSVRENILFGETYEEERYKKVINACVLSDDLVQLPYGDETPVGDRGMSLSGGQCARVNLARAVYRNADIYLLDDPFAAVDARVAQTLKTQCIDGLLKNKTVILVTHNVHYLNKTDNILLLNAGVVQFQDSILDFQKSTEYKQLLDVRENDDLEHNKEEAQNEDVLEEDLLPVSTKDDIVQKPIENEEDIAKGAMSKSVISKYIQAGGYAALFIVLLAHILTIIITYYFDFQMTAWTEEQSDVFSNQNMEFNDSLNEWRLDLIWDNIGDSVIIISGLLIFILLASILQDVLNIRYLFNANRNLHNNMFMHLIQTSLRFFQINPSGRIMNRFSEDISVLDNAVTEIFMQVFKLTLNIAGSLVLVVVIGWWNSIAFIITLFLAWKVSRSVILAAWKIRRLCGTAKSPVLNFVTSTLGGLTTIRSSKAETFVMKEFDSRQDKHTAAYILDRTFVVAFSTWIELLGVGLFAGAAYVYIILRNNGILVGQAGLSLTSIYEAITTVSYLVVVYGSVFGYMINVERILQYTAVEAEDDQGKEYDDCVIKPWPNLGEIRFERVFLRYSDKDEPVLKDLSFAVEPGTKVGIVGRTGAGKSSLISALFRLAKVDGGLYIDKVDTQKIRLSDLRSNISIIPQEPVLFGASLRSNLDPFNEFDDAALWSALDSVGLKAMFSSLEQVIDRGGKNMSLGQRQLLCLARVIVKNNKILVMDEATANVDSATDAFIQETIRSKFESCTVLIIAHRLNTIMDCDKVLVMNYGQVVEYDHPHVLLQTGDGHFAKMVEQTGKSVAQHLKRIAEQAYNKSRMESTYC